MQKFHTEIECCVEREFTLYKKLFYSPNHPDAKWRAGEENKTGGTNPYYTGVTYHVIEAGDGSYYIGRSECSVKDNFNKKIGRAIAKGRARKALWRTLCNTEYQLDNGYGLEPHTLTTSRGRSYRGSMLKDVTMKGNE